MEASTRLPDDVVRADQAARAAEALNAPQRQASPIPHSPPELPASEPAPPAETVRQDPRLEALERRAQGRRGSESEPAGSAPAEPAEPAASDAPDDAPPLRRAYGEPWQSPETGQWRVTMKTNGADREVPLTDVLADANRVAGADEKYRRAAEMLRVARSYDTQAPTPAPTPSAPQAQAPAQAAEPMTPEEIDKALFAGDEEGQRARQAMADRLNAVPAAQDPEAVAQRVAETLRQERAAELQREEAESFAREVADAKVEVQKDPWVAQAMNDPERATIAGRFSQQLLDTRSDLSAVENLQESFRLARAYLGENAPAPTVEAEPDVDPEPTRQQRKEAASAFSVAGASMRVPVGADPAPVTREDARLQLKRLRGA